MASISDQLKENPAAKELLANQKAIRQLLADPETRKVLSSLQKKNSAQPQRNLPFKEILLHFPACCKSFPRTLRPLRPCRSWTKICTELDVPLDLARKETAPWPAWKTT